MRSFRSFSPVPLIALMLGALVLTGCANAVSGAINAMRADSERAEQEANQTPEMTQLQIRQLQMRQYENVDKADILPVSLAVLQDDGFVVGSTNTDLGLLSASKNLYEKTVDDSGVAFIKGFFGSGSASTQKWSNIEANVTVTPFGESVRVRLAARLSAVLSNGTTQYEQLTDSEFYQEFFTKLEKGLFIEQEKL